MRAAIAWFTRNRVAANLLMAMLLVGGATALPMTPQKTFPDIEIDVIAIGVEYLGAAPEEVEEGVCIRIEEEYPYHERGHTCCDGREKERDDKERRALYLRTEQACQDKRTEHRERNSEHEEQRIAEELPEAGVVDHHLPFCSGVESDDVNEVAQPFESCRIPETVRTMER